MQSDKTSKKYTMGARIPSYTEKRDSARYLLPKGTTALFKKGDKLLTTVYARDISESGMLICDHFPIKRYRLDTTINDIFINIANPKNNGGSRKSNTSLFISQGRIVRCFSDQLPHTTCYGISFIDNDAFVKDRINNLVNYLGKNC